MSSLQWRYCWSHLNETKKLTTVATTTANIEGKKSCRKTISYDRQLGREPEIGIK